MPPRPAPTHFLCIPLGGAQLIRNLAAFRADVTADRSGGVGGGGGAIPEGAVRPPGTLHLTLGVMSLKDEGATREAVELLRGMRLTDVLAEARAASAAATTPAARAMGASTQPRAGGEDGGSGNGNQLRVTLRGLCAMQSPSQTSVLYAPPHDPGLVLRRFCEAVRARFTAAGLMAREERPLLLHATIMNTIYVKGKSRHRGSAGGGKRGGNRERLTVDARDVIDRYEDYVWVEGMSVEGVRICRMGARKVAGRDGEEDDEAYDVEAEVRF